MLIRAVDVSTLKNQQLSYSLRVLFLQMSPSTLDQIPPTPNRHPTIKKSMSGQSCAEE